MYILKIQIKTGTEYVCRYDLHNNNGKESTQ